MASPDRRTDFESQLLAIMNEILAELYAWRILWYEFVDRMIRNDAHFYCAFNHVHYNPVKHGVYQTVL